MTGTTAAGAVAPAAAPTGNTPAARMVAMAQAEVGQAEQPPGLQRLAAHRAVPQRHRRRARRRARGARTSPRGPRAARASRSATTARASARVDALYAWAQKSGRAIPASSGQRPSRAT